MNKVWFILGQTDYPPPEGGKGIIQLGHFVPDLERRDQPINKNAEPVSVTVYPSRLEGLEWEVERDHYIGGSADALVPIPQTAGLVSIGGEVGGIFKKSVSNFWQFEALDKLIIDPPDDYIETRIKEDKLVKAYIEKNTRFNSWSIFMITGLAIARGASGTREEKVGGDVHGGLKGSLAGVAGGGVKATSGESNANKFSFKKSSDFVWAVKLKKITKHMFYSESDLSFNNFVKGAMFSMDEDDVEDMLSEEGIDPRFVEVTEDEIFVLPLGRTSNREAEGRISNDGDL